MKRLLLFALLSLAPACSEAFADISLTSPRASSAPALALTAAAPTGSPGLELPPCPSCNPPRYAGQSQNIAGALHLVGCRGYRITVCAPPNNTFAGAGTIDIYYWSDQAAAFTTPPTVWPRNQGLDESFAALTGVTTACSAAACRCIPFPDHLVPVGMGWIYAAPDGVTLTGGGGTVQPLIEASCAY